MYHCQKYIRTMPILVLVQSLRIIKTRTGKKQPTKSSKNRQPEAGQPPSKSRNKPPSTIRTSRQPEAEQAASPQQNQLPANGRQICQPPAKQAAIMQQYDPFSSYKKTTTPTTSDANRQRSGSAEHNHTKLPSISNYKRPLH